MKKYKDSFTYNKLSSLIFLMFFITPCQTRLYTPHRMAPINKNITKVRCFLFKDWNVYDLNPLRKPTWLKQYLFFTFILSDYNITIPNTQKTLFYNFCANTRSTCRNKHSLMHVSKNDNSSCNILTNNADVLNTWEIKNQNTSNYYIDIKYSSGEHCSPGKLYSVNLQLHCDLQGKSGVISFVNMKDFKPDACENKIIAKSFDGCPKFNHYILTTFLHRFFYVFGTLMILMGLFLSILGKKIILATNFITSFIVLSILSMVVIVHFMSGQYILWLWAVFGGCLLLAAPLGWGIYKVQILFYILVGGISGYVLGLFSYHLFFSTIITNHSVSIGILNLS